MPELPVRPKIDLKIISEVVANNLCTQCGSCAGICPPIALEMRETPGGLVLPELIPERCTECGLCDMICPVIEAPKALEPHLDQPFIGPVKAAYLAEATDPKLVYEGQTGGLGRALLAWALSTGRVNGVVSVVDNPDDPLHPKAIITSDVDEVLSVARSKYCPVPVNDLIQRMLKYEGQLAYVGVACQMQGLELSMERLKKLRKKVVLRLGIFCDRVLSYRAAEFHARCAGAGPNELTHFDYRHKEMRGWPGDIRIVKKDGKTQTVNRDCRTQTRSLFTPVSCRLCPDKLNVLSDISIGDPHGVVRGKEVPSAAIVRTDTGLEYLNAAERDGWIKLSPADAMEIAEGQHIHKHVAEVQAMGNEMLHRGFHLPIVLQRGPLAVQRDRRRPLWTRITVAWGLFGQTPRGIWILRHLPTWVPRAIRSYRQIPRAMQAFRRLIRTGRVRASGPPSTDTHSGSNV